MIATLYGGLPASTPAVVKAAIAGARGRSAKPLSNDKRIDTYERQNGHSRGPLTPRQERRVTKKVRRDAKTGAQ